MKSWIVTFIGLWSTWHYMDIDSDSRFYAVVLPVLFTMFVFTFMLKLAWKLGPARGSGGGGSDFTDIGGDGGGE